MAEKYDPYENAMAERIDILKQVFGVTRYIKNLDLKKTLLKSVVKDRRTKDLDLSTVCWYRYKCIPRIN